MRLRICLILVALPRLLIAEEAATEEEVEGEILKHLTLPCLLIQSAIKLKESDAFEGEGDLSKKVQGNLLTVRLFIEENAPMLQRELKAGLLDVGIQGKKREQRMIVYQFMLASFLAKELIGGATEKSTMSFMDDDFISRLAAIGWEFPPYKPGD